MYCTVRKQCFGLLSTSGSLYCLIDSNNKKERTGASAGHGLKYRDATPPATAHNRKHDKSISTHISSYNLRQSMTSMILVHSVGLRCYLQFEAAG